MKEQSLGMTMLLLAGGAFAQANVATLDSLDIAGPTGDIERVPTHTVVPEYPREAWLERIEGDVQVCFFVTRGGKPYNVSVRSSDHKVFERPAREAVKMSWFDSISGSENRSLVKTCRTFQFRLEPLEPETSADPGESPE